MLSIPGWATFLLALLPSAAVMASWHQNGGYNYAQDVRTTLGKRQIDQSPFTQGLPLVDGRIPLRVEIRQMQKYHEQWTLYILALSWLQYTDQEDPYSWYRLAGIHGAPFTDYGGVKALPDAGTDGFCPHVSILFPTWHRPYLVFIEQAMFKVAGHIASLYPEGPMRDRYQKAAATFRLPYWDWAVRPPANESCLPLSIGGGPNVTADGPDGPQVIANPLYSFAFKPLNATAFPQFPFYEWNETKRAPRPLNSSSAISDNSFIAKTLDANLPNYQQRLYNLFANYDNYSEWSNEAWIPQGNKNTSAYDSIESLHDGIHLAAGGNFGHMAIIAYSAFDPVFFLHHANVDRLFAMWQVLHNVSYVEPMAAVVPTRTIEVGNVQDSQTELTPFWVNETQLWNSDMVRDHEVFGYTYADVATKKRADVIAVINDLYATYSPATMAMQSERRSGTGKTTVGQAPGGAPWARRLVQNGSYREWTANIRVNKYALGSSFTIYLFLGDVPPDSSSWELASNRAGSLGIFAGHPLTVRPPEGQPVSGTVPLTWTLMGLVRSRALQSLDPDDAEAYLKHALQLRVMVNDGTVVGPEKVDGLVVSIASSPVRAAGSRLQLARRGELVTHFDLHTS